MAINGKIPENSRDFEGEKNPGEGSDAPDNQAEKIQKEHLEHHTHEELNSLRDSLNKAHAHETLDDIDWLGRNAGGGKGTKKEKTGTSAIFEKPVDTHVAYSSDVFGYDSARSTLILAKDLTLDAGRLVLHPFREIRKTLDIWGPV